MNYYIVQNVHQWPAVACGGLSQHCQWLSLVTQTKSAEVQL